MQMDFTDLPYAKDGKVKTSKDKAGSQAAMDRSDGRCEVWELLAGVRFRCHGRATEVHHMIGGRGKRGRGKSALSDHKQAICKWCHDAITGGVGGKKLIRKGGPVPMWDDCYLRVP